MLYLNKFLEKIKENPLIFKSQQIILNFGLTSSQIKELKKFSTENNLIYAEKQEYFLTENGEKYILEHPAQKWQSKDFSLRPEINLELLKEEKTPATLTKALRLLAKHLLENQPLKEFSVEHALYEDLKKCKNLHQKIQDDILSGKRILLETIYSKYHNLGLTKSLIFGIILIVLSENISKIAIYEKSQFQLIFNGLMFDRMIACPQNFEIQKTEMPDEYILKDVSKIILNKKSDNILEITKGLYATIKSFDKYTMNTQNLTPKTLRLRNVIINAKDPISLFERDIPKVLSGKMLHDSDREFLNNLKISLDELKNCTSNLVIELKDFIFSSFKAKTKKELAERFLAIKDFIGEKELKILYNNVLETDVNDELWTNRIATFINKYRVPKDWSDEDYADFKVKTKELAFKFEILESTLGTNEITPDKNSKALLDKFFKLSKPEQISFLRFAIKS